jgi:Na+/H+ antiporter NhaD/arsenite permease-like protein
MASQFGWKAVAGIVVANVVYALLFRRELAELRSRAAAVKPDTSSETRPPIPAWITAAHLAVLALAVYAAHTTAAVVGLFLFFLAFHQATAPYQDPVDLRPPLLVGFFLAGLVIHGALQQWWIEPVLGRLDPRALMGGAMLLTAFNDNAAITYLSSLVPGFTDALKYAVVAGAVTGGGLTVIANAPNPAGQAILARYFDGSILAGGLFLGALGPTVVMALCFLLL